MAKPAHHAKAAAAHGGSGGAGGRHKAAASKKHVATSKHHGTAKKRGLALGEAVACCAAEAVAASARLAGWPVGDADVLALYELTADSPDAGASILATLDAAYVFGLAGVRPVSFRAECGGGALGGCREGRGLLVEEAQGCIDPRFDDLGHHLLPQRPLVDIHAGQPLILGLDLPGPHTVLADLGYWWSWGELYDPAGWPDAVVEEAWSVTWP